MSNNYYAIIDHDQFIMSIRKLRTAMIQDSSITPEAYGNVYIPLLSDIIDAVLGINFTYDHRLCWTPLDPHVEVPDGTV